MRSSLRKLIWSTQSRLLDHPRTGGGFVGKVSEPLKWILRLLLVVAVALVLVAVSQLHQAISDVESAKVTAFHGTGLIEPVAKGLASAFTDVHDRMLADPPTDPALLQDPQTIVLAHIDIDEKDPDAPVISWPQFEEYLAKALGRPVTDLDFDNGPDQLATIKTNAITLVALHAADVPYLVNNFGFQPIAVIGSDGGANGNHLDILVPADSPITSTAMLRGHTLTCTVPSSITGYRAAIALLMQNDGLRANGDYNVTWSLKQKISILGIASGKYEAAAVSDDSLQAHLRGGTSRNRRIASSTTPM